jgi:Holliday junction resolvasome RuvABC ATP-dependent DNA helicase subunit
VELRELCSRRERLRFEVNVIRRVAVKRRVPTLAVKLRRQVSVIMAITGVKEINVHIHERILSSFFLGAEPDFHSQLDETDIKIINRLLRDGRANFAEIAQVVGLSVSGCRTRIQRLLESAVLQIGAIKQRSDMTSELLFGIGVNAQGDCREVIDAILASPEQWLLVSIVREQYFRPLPLDDDR